MVGLLILLYSCINDDYTELLKGVKDATYTGIKNAGMDVVIKDWEEI